VGYFYQPALKSDDFTDRLQKTLSKTHLQNIAIAAALNIDRIVNWLNGVPSSDFLLIPEIIPRFKYLKPYISNQIWAAVKSQPCALYGEKLNA